MKITKAIITAAAPEQGRLPLQQLVDRTGQNKSALQLIIEEALQAGVDDICVVIRPGDRDGFKRAAGPHSSRLTYVEQTDPRGYGDALLRARSFTADQPFLHLVGDHLYLSNTDRCCATQLISVAEKEECSVSAVQATRESKLPFFGTVGGQPVAQRSDLYEISKVIEKPTPTLAEQELIVAGLRSGYYLCLFGMHVLTPTLMDLLAEAVSKAEPGQSIQLSDSLSALAQRERYFALEAEGTRYNIGEKYGLLIAQLALALTGNDRDQILTELVELLATREQ
jgi:UTP--glucose-1-phosphate uridylyltransferase